MGGLVGGAIDRQGNASVGLDVRADGTHDKSVSELDGATADRRAKTR